MIEYHRLFLHLYLFINGIKKPVLFWAWPPLLTITFVRFFYNIAYRYAPCLHSAVWYPIVTDYMYSSLLLMGIWEFLVLGSCEQYHSKHSITCLWVSLDTYFFGGVYISRSGNCWVVRSAYMFSFSRYCQIILQSSPTNLHSYQQYISCCHQHLLSFSSSV